MRRFAYSLCLFAASVFIINACSQEEEEPVIEAVPEHVINTLEELGFDTENQAVLVFEEGYLVEGDIYLTQADLDEMKPANGLRIATEEQYSTNNLVNASGGRTITVYIPVASSGGRGKKSSGFSTTYANALDEAIARYNAEPLSLTMQRITSTSADIVFTRLGKGDERRGILGSAGFPTASGDPYGEIKMSGVLESSYGLDVDGIATIMAHELGHCVGFRHTDYFDRSISCGGSTANEGSAGIGANHIPGTPTGATLAAKSWMLACTDGGNRPFNNDDKTALDYLY